MSIQSARIFDVSENTLLASGELRFRLYPDLHLAGIEIDDYHCCISPELPVTKADLNIYLISNFEGILGVVLASSTDPEKTVTFEALLEEYSLFTHPVVDDKTTLTRRVTIWLEHASEKVKQRLIDRSIDASLNLMTHGERIKTGMERCGESQNVPIALQSSTKNMKSATASLLQWVEDVAAEAETASQLVGRQMSTFTSNKSPQFPQSSDTKRLAASTFRALKKVLGAAKDSAVILTESAHQTTVDLVQHKYGERVSSVVAEGLESLGDLGRATLALGRLELTNMAANLVKGLKKQREGVPI